MGPFDNLGPMGKRGPLSMGAVQRQTARTLFGNFKQFNPLYKQSLYDLYNESLNPQGIEDQIAPTLATIGDQQKLAEGQLDRSLAARGLGDSSAMASGLGALASTGATARAQAITGARSAAQMRQDLLKQMLQQSLGGAVMGGAGQAAGIANAARQQDILKAYYDAQSGFGFGDVLGALGGLAGMAGGLGWRPFQKKPQF